MVCKLYETRYRKPYVSTKKLLELINKFSKVARYKINIQKYVAFLYTKKDEFSKQSYLQLY